MFLAPLVAVACIVVVADAVWTGRGAAVAAASVAATSVFLSWPSLSLPVSSLPLLVEGGAASLVAAGIVESGTPAQTVAWASGSAFAPVAHVSGGALVRIRLSMLRHWFVVAPAEAKLQAMCPSRFWHEVVVGIAML